MSGWSKTKTSILQKVKVPVDHLSTCNQVYKGLSLNMFCAMYKDGSSVTCDLGGPLQCKEDINGYYRLQGVMSFGDGCGQAGKYGVYTVVRHYLQWIKTQSNGAIRLPKIE